MATEAATAILYGTCTDLELIQKACLEAKAAVAACKALHVLRVNENLMKKRAWD